MEFKDNISKSISYRLDFLTDFNENKKSYLLLHFCLVPMLLLLSSGFNFMGLPVFGCIISTLAYGALLTKIREDYIDKLTKSNLKNPEDYIKERIKRTLYFLMRNTFVALIILGWSYLIVFLLNNCL